VGPKLGCLHRQLSEAKCSNKPSGEDKFFSSKKPGQVETVFDV